jgi:hypothetical protein
MALPLLLVDITSGKVSIQEDRGLANPPSMSDLKKQPGKFKGDFGRWIEDSIGFREKLLAQYNKTIGKKIPFNGISYTIGAFSCLIGEQGHHYFTNMNGSLIPQFMGKQYLSD